MGPRVTISYDGDPGLLAVWPLLEDLPDITLVLDGDILNNGISLQSLVFRSLCDPLNPQDACRYASS